MMIYIGLTGWGDHDSLYENANIRNKLEVYAGHFPIVEVDSSFYAIQPEKTVDKWVHETPPSFRFVVKAYQGMTGHSRGKHPYKSKDEMFDAYIQFLQPFIASNKLAMVLFQFPPWFDCKSEHVQYLRWVKKKMGDVPCALEFRHQSWYFSEWKNSCIRFMKEEGWIHSICDEPQAGIYSIPLIAIPTHPEKTLVRMHGRNIAGWNKQRDENWRVVRYLYDYRDEELLEWKGILHKLEKESKEIYMVFNNNSGGHAAKNAKRMIELLGIEYKGLAPRQMDLF